MATRSDERFAPFEVNVTQHGFEQSQPDILGPHFGQENGFLVDDSFQAEGHSRYDEPFTDDSTSLVSGFFEPEYDWHGLTTPATSQGAYTYPSSCPVREEAATVYPAGDYVLPRQNCDELNAPLLDLRCVGVGQNGGIQDSAPMPCTPYTIHEPDLPAAELPDEQRCGRPLLGAPPSGMPFPSSILTGNDFSTSAIPLGGLSQVASGHDRVFSHGAPSSLGVPVDGLTFPNLSSQPVSEAQPMVRGRSGGLSQDQRNKAAHIRRIGACWLCHIKKTPVGMDLANVLSHGIIDTCHSAATVCPVQSVLEPFLTVQIFAIGGDSSIYSLLQVHKVRLDARLGLASLFHPSSSSHARSY